MPRLIDVCCLLSCDSPAQFKDRVKMLSGWSGRAALQRANEASQLRVSADGIQPPQPCGALQLDTQSDFYPYAFTIQQITKWDIMRMHASLASPGNGQSGDARAEESFV